MTLPHLGRIAAVFAVVCWSAGNVIVARLDLSGIEIAFWRHVSYTHLTLPTIYSE